MARRQIIIYLDSALLQAVGEVIWVVLEENHRPGPVFRGDLKTAANHASGCIVTLMVPGMDILLTKVALPNMSRQRLLKAIPFALEEQVATDLDELHFVSGKRSEEDDSLAVAVVERDIVKNWLGLLKNAGIQPDNLTSDVFGVPYVNESWTILVTGDDPMDRVVMRYGPQAGLTLERQNIESMLTLALGRLEKDARPKQISLVMLQGLDSAALVSSAWSEDEASLNNVRGHTSSLELDHEPGFDAGSDFDLDFEMDEENEDDLELPTLTINRQTALTTAPVDAYHDNLLVTIQALCDQYDVELVTDTQDGAALAYLAQHYLSGSAVNILQGEFSRKEQLEKLLRPWIPAAAVAALWLIMQGGLLIADFQALSQKEQNLRQQVVSVFKEAFPEVKNIVNPRKQMESELKKLKAGGANQAGLISLLHKTGEILSGTESMIINGLRYKASKLDIDLEISDLQALDELKLKLMKEGSLSVEIVSASSRDGKVAGRIQVEPKS